jgi:hypothetical protein
VKRRRLGAICMRPSPHLAARRRKQPRRSITLTLSHRTVACGDLGDPEGSKAAAARAGGGLFTQGRQVVQQSVVACEESRRRRGGKGGCLAKAAGHQPRLLIVGPQPRSAPNSSSSGGLPVRHAVLCQDVWHVFMGVGQRQPVIVTQHGLQLPTCCLQVGGRPYFQAERTCAGSGSSERAAA